MSTATDIVDEIHAEIADQETPEAPESAETAEATPEEKPAKARAVKQTHACLCRSYEVYDKTDPESVFSTGCESETKSTFAQGHDARLVSFLVDGYYDGYGIRQLTQTETGAVETVEHTDPSAAVRDVSAALQAKAEKAVENRRKKIEGREERAKAREALKAKRAAEKEAAKQAKADAKAATAAAGPGSEVPVGDLAPLAEGEVRIKVGEFLYNATLDEDGNAEYIDGAGSDKVAVQGAFEVVEV